MKHSVFHAVPLILILLCPAFIAADEGRSVAATRFPKPPVIDGRPDEEVWNLAQPVEGLIQFEPQNGERSPLRTVVRIGYDDDALYVAFYCYDPNPSGISAALTKRDSSLTGDDAVAIFLDTFNDDSSCTAFVTNLLGTQWDFRVADNGRSTDSSWDATWFSAATRTEDGWTAEFAIPFRILKFKAGADRTWGLNFGRSYPRRLETSYWVGPLENELRVSQFGNLTGLDLQGKLKHYEIIPYVISQLQEGEKTEAEVGIDLRYRVTSTLGTDIALNPDFATIEADSERINLTRFELRLTEKRPFFLEGAELFRQRINQFYSRRIGDIPWGAKLNGKLAGWDVSFIGAQSDPAETAGDFENEGRNGTYTVIRGKRGLFGGSNIGFLAANRRWRGENQGSIGVDATLFFTKTLGMTAQFVRAHGPENDGAVAWFLRPAYDSANSHFHVRYSNWDKGLMENMNAVGFVRDDDRKEFDTNISHTFWLKRGGIEKISVEENYNRYWSQEGVLRSWESDFEFEIEFKNKWGFEISRNDEFKLYEKGFNNRRTSLEVGFDNRGGRSASVSYSFGRNYDSDLQLLRGGVSFKITDAWNVNYALTRLWLDPDPDDDSTWIHSIRSNYYFNKDFYLKLFFQTNSVINKKNTQAVLVWRFLPPFGALQFAYQYGTSRFGTASDQGHTLFSKMSWVF